MARQVPFENGSLEQRSGGGRDARALARARRIIGRIEQIVAKRWRPLLRAHGGTKRDADAIERAFDHSGFDFE